MNREEKTIQAMIRMYCTEKHSGGKVPCKSCRELLDYAKDRIQKCPFGKNKPVCQDCTVHCYKPEMREKVKEVMRYAGPKMMRKHPILAIAHLFSSLRKTK